METAQLNSQTSWNFRHVIVLLLILALLLVQFAYFSQARLLSDESFNFRQISRFIAGDLSMEPLMNVIPGYHALVALIMGVTGKTGLFSARFVSVVISAVSILLFYLLTWRIYTRPSLVKTLQYTFLPILFPFFALVYTDVLALFLVMLSLYLAVWGHPNLAGFAGILSVLARTNNISWLVFVYVFIYYTQYGFDLKSFSRSLRQTWVFWLGLALFLVFLIMNKGIALGDREAQPLFRFEAGNISFLLFLFFFIFLPHNLASLPAIIRLTVKRWWLIPVVLITTLGLFLLFRNTHPFNNVFPDYYLRNKLLMAVDAQLSFRLGFFLPVAYTILSLIVTRLSQPRFYWIYPFTLLSLIPFWLVEPRYYMIPFCLFILFKEDGPAWVEYAMVGFFAIASLIIVYFMRSEAFFI